MLLAGLLHLLGCASEAPAPSPRPHGPQHPLPPGAPPGPGSAGGPGGSLLIPVDDPLWSKLDGLLPDARGYGEANWDDVRMRVVGHLAVLGRDRARLAAQAGDWAGCATRYSESAAAIAGVHVGGEIGPPIQAALQAAAARDADLCQDLDEGVQPVVGGGTIALLRAKWVNIVVKANKGQDARAEASALAAEARLVTLPSGLDLDAFGDFDARHKLRVKLVEAWADAASPFSATEPLGYWTAGEVVRQAQGIALAADAVAKGAPATATLADNLPPSKPPPWSSGPW